MVDAVNAHKKDPMDCFNTSLINIEKLFIREVCEAPEHPRNGATTQRGLRRQAALPETQ